MSETRHDEIQGEILHVYDGIEEADNELPRWWLATFYVAILFGAGYWVVYQAFEVADNPVKAYAKAKLDALNKGGDVTEERLMGLVADPLMVESGQSTFKTNCSKCHGSNAEGKIGPNLTDPFWLHGGSALDIYNTVFHGQPAKGMPAWNSLGPASVQQVVAYLLSIRNSNVPGKAPQGKEWTPADQAEAKDGADGAGAAPAGAAPAGAAPEGAAPEGADNPAGAAPKG
jgi:cytochrome c oxidase cbb3-type subunit 3